MDSIFFCLLTIELLYSVLEKPKWQIPYYRIEERTSEGQGIGQRKVVEALTL